MERLRRRVEQAEARLEAERASAGDLRKAHAAAEELARQAREESAFWES